MGCLPCDREANRELQVTATAQHYRNIILHVTNLGKDQNSKLNVWFLLNLYHFHITFNLKNHQPNMSNHLRSNQDAWHHHYLESTKSCLIAFLVPQESGSRQDKTVKSLHKLKMCERPSNTKLINKNFIDTVS